MGDPVGPALSPWAAAPKINASQNEGASVGVSKQVQLLLEILIVLMCVGAVTGNILVIVLVAATKAFHSVTSVLIINLAVSDLLVGAGVMPFVALSVLNHRWVDCTALCLYVGYTSSVYCTASVLTLAAIALDRYHSIMDCLHYSSRCTLWRACAVVLWIWLQALATSCPPLLGWSSISYVVPMYSCAVDWASTPSYTAFVAVLSYLTPALIILFCYVNIMKVARSHARRIHTLEDSVQRSRSLNSGSPSCCSSPQYCKRPHCPATLIYHVSGHLLSKGTYVSPTLADSIEQHVPPSRRLLSFLAQTSSQPPSQNSQQHQNHHGVVRLFLVILTFFLCWTPYILVALIQAAETALVGCSSLVPPSVVTVSHWLVLLNSDINPLLYALLSKRFQGALQGLRQKIRACLRNNTGGVKVRAQGEDGKSGDPCTLTTADPRPAFSSEDSACDDTKSSSPISTVSTHYKLNPEEDLCTSHSGCIKNASQHTSMDHLRVPCWPQEGSRLPSSALTREHQATFFFGQITVRVEHNV
ncbi:alpha-1A adrenergic receptor-like [Takifugu flavidus]|uniref:Alpha-1D adrenergic receptor n=1 Tax=Takifugu flavidus TaxID=433684 RepID=A0A5C6PJ82_9TELE|nr:alpha-1A adrenergic receptor-like [Takifugu flavidus]TWW78758.1 Alpha-1D adrenergic receptor [Takifugu flavidus]